MTHKANSRKNWGALIYKMIIFACFLHVSNLYGQSIAVKSNLLYDLTSSLNIGGEIRCDDTHTFSLSVNYNPWNFKGNKKIKHLLIQPEYRKWLSGEVFMGSFIGFQAHYTMFNFGGILPANNRYQGNLVGCGITYGYQWMISPKWNLETGVSLGYARLNYKNHEQPSGAPLIEKTHYNYWGPTQIGIALVYFIQ